MSLELAICLITLFGMAGIGTPIGYSIMMASIMYFAIGGFDIALTGEKILQGLYKSFVLLAVPLFISAANIMNGGTITDRLLKFCIAVVGRFKGGLGHVNVVASLIFSGMSGSAVADAAGIGKIIIGMMTKAGHYTRGYAAAITAASGGWNRNAQGITFNVIGNNTYTLTAGADYSSTGGRLFSYR